VEPRSHIIVLRADRIIINTMVVEEGAADTGVDFKK
jgi:hypothetical protein